MKLNERKKNKKIRSIKVGEMKNAIIIIKKNRIVNIECVEENLRKKCKKIRIQN